MPIDPDTGLENWDCPDSFNVTKMYQSLNYTHEHNGQLPNDHPRGEDSNAHDGSLTVSDSFLDQLRAMVPADVEEHTRLIIVDGILLFCDPLIYNEFDCSIFIHAGKETLKQRREARQGYITQEGILLFILILSYTSSLVSNVFDRILGGPAWLFRSTGVASVCQVELTLISRWKSHGIESKHHQGLFGYEFRQ